MKCEKDDLGFESENCSCNAGCTGSGKNCQDVDECTTNAHNCPEHSTCHNLEAGFNCIANSGYECDTDFVDSSSTETSCYNSTNCEGNTCQFKDIDECTTNTDDCPSTEDQNNVQCVNTVGSYLCKQKIITDNTCSYDSNGRIDVPSGWHYRGTSEYVTNERKGNKDWLGRCRAANPCTTTGDPYCYLDETYPHYDYCQCKREFNRLYLNECYLS